AVVATFFRTGPPEETYVAWKNASDATIWYSSSTDGIAWSTPKQIQGKGGWQAETDQGPSLAFGSDEALYVAWKGKNSGTDRIWYSTTLDGVNWTDQAPVPGANTAYAPS